MYKVYKIKFTFTSMDMYRLTLWLLLAVALYYLYTQYKSSNEMSCVHWLLVVAIVVIAYALWKQYSMEGMRSIGGMRRYY